MSISMLYPALATVAYALLLAGFFLRKKRKPHAILMSAGMALDISLVLTLELTKDAIDTVLRNDLTLWQQAHVYTSTMAVLLYVPVFALGCVRYFRPSAANLGLREWHELLGYGALAARSAGFLFMFSMLGR